MPIQILINRLDQSDPLSNYVTWAPSQCKLVSTEAVDTTVTLSNQTNGGGQIVFITAANGVPQNTLQITVPAGGSANFFIAGKYDKAANGGKGQGFASTKDKDTSIVATDAAGNVLATQSLMVRVRKNANTLLPEERDRFLSALARLNEQGIFFGFQNSHGPDALDEMHGRDSFLPWHRAFLLDLERKLQVIDPSVSLPYWKFDEPADAVLNRAFMGLADPRDRSFTIQFTSTNPLVNWQIRSVTNNRTIRVNRRVEFDANAGSALDADVQRNENATLSIGASFAPFVDEQSGIEWDPHNHAHTSFRGLISSADTAPADPLFFLLHANVDRLWSKWQWVNGLFDSTQVTTYTRQGNGVRNGSAQDNFGNYTLDSLWPWDDDSAIPRPQNIRPPLVGFTASMAAAAPGQTPLLNTMIDYQGQLSANANLGFSYDDVPFDFPTAV